MTKNALLAAAVAASLVSAPSFASYISTVDLTGNIAISGYNDGDSSTYTVKFMDLDGSVTTQLPPTGNYTVALDGTGVLDISPLVPSIVFTPNNLDIFTGWIDIFNVINPNQSFIFSAGTAGVNDPFGFPVPPMDFGINYDGETTDAVMNFLNALRTMVGLPPVVDPSGAGSLSVSGTLFSDGAVLEVVETAVGWPGLGGALVQVDGIINPLTQQPMFGGPDLVDVNFDINMTATASAVPEPASLALLGLGLVGLVAARRRRTI